jgi:periplasmic divalent cation tolerance protein
MSEIEVIVVWVTASDKNQAQSIAQTLLERRLVACVNIFGEVDAMYWWKGSLAKSREVVMMIKTRRELFSSVEAVVKEQHSYDVPEVIAAPLVEGSAAYLEWVKDSTISSTDSGSSG